jgi:energy-coupling factor transporter ATP-binding protein EcfA2
MSMMPWRRRFADDLKIPPTAVPVPRAAPGEILPGEHYERFKVILDEPSVSPSLGFAEYAQALSEVIERSRAEFAVGIFGSWGSGKTTLMKTIKAVVSQHENVVPVWFTAWRYEKEPNLIVPLLDVLRDALREKGRNNKDARPWARRASRAVGRAGFAFLQGLTVKADFPGGGVDAELGKVIDAYRAGRERAAPLSAYHKGFALLQEAIKSLSGDGTRRVVIFIDDLDRCMPLNALDVLESMKLFFDVQGCVFVVGLDQEIAERAVAAKYQTTTDQIPGVSGAEYVKKMFQVQFTLPSVWAHQLEDYLTCIQNTADFGTAQLDDFRNVVRPHVMKALSDGDPINPRELKRLINLYTIQAKILSRRLKESFKPTVLLALLLMSHRLGWKPIYDELVADTEYVQSALQMTLASEDWPSEVSLSGITFSLPSDLAEYLRGTAADLLTERHLHAYILAAESAASTDPWVLQARTIVSRLRRAVDQFAAGKGFGPEALRAVTIDVDSLHQLIHSRRDSFGRLGLLRERLTEAVDQLARRLHEIDSTSGSAPTFADLWDDQGIPLLKSIDADLLEWHRYVSLGD